MIRMAIRRQFFLLKNLVQAKIIIVDKRESHSIELEEELPQFDHPHISMVFNLRFEHDAQYCWLTVYDQRHDLNRNRTMRFGPTANFTMISDWLDNGHD